MQGGRMKMSNKVKFMIFSSCSYLGSATEQMHDVDVKNKDVKQRQVSSTLHLFCRLSFNSWSKLF